MPLSIIHTLLAITGILTVCCLLASYYVVAKYPGRPCDIAATIGPDGTTEIDILEPDTKIFLHRRIEIDGELCDDYRYLGNSVSRRAYYLIKAWHVGTFTLFSIHIVLGISYIALIIINAI